MFVAVVTVLVRVQRVRSAALHGVQLRGAVFQSPNLGTQHRLHLLEEQCSGSGQASLTATALPR